MTQVKSLPADIVPWNLYVFPFLKHHMRLHVRHCLARKPLHLRRRSSGWQFDVVVDQCVHEQDFDLVDGEETAGARMFSVSRESNLGQYFVSPLMDLGFHARKIGLKVTGPASTYPK